ncbi:Sulfate transporter/antisigma-factor antagonist STAS [Candidatus Methylobacter favarea]|uniref:Sulfate transporter/antisigma-factor antagonist STAS n=1 Tax=Candidatus Methylobacter favarea TaxID=2707345 RepID=A0A8S0Y703_9GAMM|nr:STAS domain-containing protein [Candidatus Methylobacter favarea]CAA9892589.1 Sulfate transporter/antisigma-factor antagonist STAS [Candidatus Methylobacter favarea]
MRANDKNNLIGYDPLAWLDEAGSEIKDQAEIQIMPDDGAEEQPGLSDDEAISGTRNLKEDTGNTAIDSIINLEANLTIQKVLKLHEKLKNSLTANDTVIINAAEVASIDTASLQLFVALKKTAVKLQKEIVFAAPSRRFIDSAALLGLLEVLDVNG